MFDIHFDQTKTNPDPLLTRGRITIGNFSELFESDLSFWGRHDYERQWKLAIERVVNEREDSCLIVSMANPAKSNFIVIWPLYPEVDTVHVQNHLLFLNECRAPFSIDAPWDSMQSRSVRSEDEERVSEWSISIDKIRRWLERL